jgi:hypothetical protein
MANKNNGKQRSEQQKPEHDNAPVQKQSDDNISVDTIEIQNDTLENSTGSLTADKVESTKNSTQSIENAELEVVVSTKSKEDAKMDEMRKNEDIVGDPTAIQESDVAAAIYSELSKLFGQGSQLFTMEMPGRTLNQLDFAYSIEGYNDSQLKKPYVVAENEFRLTDSMLDIAPIVQGPNGSRVSTAYDAVINNYIPRITDLKEYILDKMVLRQFLLQEITDSIDGEVVTCSRMEFCQRTYIRYLEQKYKWDQEKINRQLQCQSEDNLNEYAKWLATTAWTKDHELSALFNDSVVRGFYHEVMTVLGFLDVKSPSEILATTKENRRSSVRRSMDGSMEVLPVQLQPSNWFESLSPNFSPTDLTLSPEFLKLQLQQKQALLSSLEAELRFLTRKNIDDSILDELEKEVKRNEAILLAEEEKYLNTFGSVALEAVKMVIQYYTGGDMTKLLDGDFVSNITSGDTSKALANYIGMAQESAQKLLEGMIELDKSNLAYFEAFNELISVGRKVAEAQTGNLKKEMDIIKHRIGILTREIDQLLAILMSDVAKNGSIGPSYSGNTLLPAPRYNDSNVFMDIVFDKSIFSSSTYEEKASTYTKMKGSIGKFFTKINVDAEYSTSKSAFMSELLNSNFTIGLRAAKVTIDRGGWFEPLLLKTSGNYQRLNSHTLGGAGLSVNAVYNAFIGTQEEIKTDENGKFAASKVLTHNAEGIPYAMPGYPVSFIIVKDVVIKTESSGISDENIEEMVKSSYSANANLFGIRTNGGSSNQSFVGKSSYGEQTEAFYIRIPGPQILGWFVELTDEDQATPYESLSQSKFFDEIMDGMKAYSKKMNNKDDVDPNIESVASVEVTTVRLPSVGGGA